MFNRFLVLVMLLAAGAALASPAQTILDSRELFSQIRKKAEQGNPEAELILGSFYASGTGVGQSLSKAFKWHRKAAEHGLAKGQYQLGLDYAQGLGVKADQATALNWFLKAADQGLVEAQFAVGSAYLNGKGTDHNATEGVRWLKKGADAGYPEALYELGNCYLEGSGVPKDPVAGVNWLKQAAEAGLPSAQNALGLCYQQGKGIERDYVQAYKWLALAEAHDDENAAEIRVSLAKVESLLTPGQITEGQRLAREFKVREIGSQPAATNQVSLPGTNVVQNSPPSGDSNLLGSVSVAADDPKAEVMVDGNFVGNAPARVKLAPGSHLIEVKSPGKKTFRRELMVSAGADLTLRAQLQAE
jgi:TPR repeat protein